MIGFAMCGSFCTFSSVFPQLEALSSHYEILPIMSPAAYQTDTRFGSAESWIQRMEQATGHRVLHTLAEVEPIGPKKLLDALIVAPCTGNTLAKLANGISDTSVTLAVKAHLRNARPVVIAVSSNDALAVNFRNLGALSAMRHFWFVPYRQDDALGKPTSLVADMEQIFPTLQDALQGHQVQPILSGR